MITKITSTNQPYYRDDKGGNRYNHRGANSNHSVCYEETEARYPLATGNLPPGAPPIRDSRGGGGGGGAMDGHGTPTPHPNPQDLHHGGGHRAHQHPLRVPEGGGSYDHHEVYSHGHGGSQHTSPRPPPLEGDGAGEKGDPNPSVSRDRDPGVPPAPPREPEDPRDYEGGGVVGGSTPGWPGHPSYHHVRRLGRQNLSLDGGGIGGPPPPLLPPGTGGCGAGWGGGHDVQRSPGANPAWDGEEGIVLVAGD
ncbi:unnamed protein product [Discosporangium mesarthrocarpum]